MKDTQFCQSRITLKVSHCGLVQTAVCAPRPSIPRGSSTTLSGSCFFRCLKSQILRVDTGTQRLACSARESNLLHRVLQLLASHTRGRVCVCVCVRVCVCACLSAYQSPHRLQPYEVECMHLAREFMGNPLGLRPCLCCCQLHPQAFAQIAH